MGLFSPVIGQYISKVACCVNGDVLDIGCGDKPYRSAFVNARSYVGIDRPSKADDIRLNATDRQRALDVGGCAESLPFSNASFDAVVSTQLIEHLAQPDLFFKESSRVLRQGGLLIITFPLFAPLHEEPYDYFRYTEYSINNFCFDNGLQVTSIEKMGGGWLMIGYFVRDFLYKDSYKAKSFLWGRILRSLGSFIYNLLSRLDKYDRHPEGTLNYLVTARK